MIEKLKDKMRAAGYNFFSIKDNGSRLVLSVNQELYDGHGSRPRYFKVLDDLEITFDGGADAVNIERISFGLENPIGEYDLNVP